MATPTLFKWRHFLPKIILLNVCWYCRYSLSYRDLEKTEKSRQAYLPPLAAIDEEFYDDQLDINVKGVFFTLQKLAELLNAGASVILNASAVNEKGAAMGRVYFATKAAVRSLARSLAAD